MALYRHGDVMIGQVDALPGDAKKRGNVILAYGESTGHSHRIADPKTAETFEYKGDIYLKVIAPKAQLIHEEHATIELPGKTEFCTGIYRVWQQREYTPEEVRRIYD